jgi:hypothetical protein
MLFPTDSRTGSHVLGDFTSNLDSSHGVRLSGGSTGGVVIAEGDDANISLTVKGKGTGAVVIGDSSQNVQIAKTFVVQFTPAVLNASTSVQSTITVTGLVAGRPLLFTPTTPGLSMAYAFRAQCSTNDELRFTQQNITASTIGTGESTARGILIQL